MNFNTIDIKKLTFSIHNVVESKYSREDVFLLFQYCKNIALTYIQIQYHSDKLYFKNKITDEKFLEDYAIDFISPLFTRDNDGGFTEFIRYFKPFLSEILANNELGFFYLKKLVISKTKQEIFEHFKKEDPAGWKILRNISEAPKRNKNISVNSDYGSIYFYIKGGTFPEDYAPEKPSIESEQLDLWISKVVKKTSTTPAIIEKILKSLQSQDHYKKFLSREMIFKSMCVVLAYSTIALHEDYGFYENYLTVINKETLMKAIADIIEEKYLISGKISSEEQTLYKKILNQYFSDLVEDGFTEKLTWYLKEFSNGIKIKQKQINQIEYIIKIGKKYLRQCVN